MGQQEDRRRRRFVTRRTRRISPIVSIWIRSCVIWKSPRNTTLWWNRTGTDSPRQAVNLSKGPDRIQIRSIGDNLRGRKENATLGNTRRIFLSQESANVDIVSLIFSLKLFQSVDCRWLRKSNRRYDSRKKRSVCDGKRQDVRETM